MPKIKTDEDAGWRFLMAIRALWKKLTPTEQRILRETVFRPTGKGR